MATSLTRRTALVAGIAVLLVAFVVWHFAGNHGAKSGAGVIGDPDHGVKATPIATSSTRVDPRRLVRGSIAGTVTAAETHAPLANVQVCARGVSQLLDSDLLRSPTCATTDKRGAYVITNLFPARYSVSANAPTFLPELYVTAEPRLYAVWVAAGEAKVGIDLALYPGGVEITGTVSDITGGPIAKARVWNGEYSMELGVATETDDQGAFAMWVAPGWTTLAASADGYTESTSGGSAPNKIEILLTPEASLAGTVIDAASGRPVAGARVYFDSWRAAQAVYSDEAGAFRLARLAPGRYDVMARTAQGWGRSNGSTLVGLGEAASGVVVKLYPAVRVSGIIHVPDAKSRRCPRGEVALDDHASERHVTLLDQGDGTLAAEGVLPGTYLPAVTCAGFVAHDAYPPVVVADKPVTDLVWDVDSGATLHGKVLTTTGVPIGSATVAMRTTETSDHAKPGWGRDESTHDGSYRISGLRPGAYRIEVDSDTQGRSGEPGFPVQIAGTETIEKDLVLDDVGRVHGRVVDETGAPIEGIRVKLRRTSVGEGYGSADTDASGTFTMKGVTPGSYRVLAQRGWSQTLRKPGTNDDAKQGEAITVKANQETSVTLTLEPQNGSISGIVVDVVGKPVSDAYLSSARESDAAGARATSVSEARWGTNVKPVVTSVDGTFTLEKLAPGNYTVHAYRRGGGEAFAEHIAVGTTTAKLQIKPTGVIAGTVTRASGEIIDLDVVLSDRKTSFYRNESSYHTGGHFALSDLPAGTFELTATTPGGSKTITVTLAEGETKTGVEIALEELIAITGRLVDAETKAPVVGMKMFAEQLIGRGGGMRSSSTDSATQTTDETGRFVIERAPVGRIRLRGFPRNWKQNLYGWIEKYATVPRSGALGDVAVLKERVKREDKPGDLGVKFAEDLPDADPCEVEAKVSYIDPSAQAAKSGLVVGDVVTAIDGFSITGCNSPDANTLLRAKPGAKLALTLARGETVTIVVGQP